MTLYKFNLLYPIGTKVIVKVEGEWVDGVVYREGDILHMEPTGRDRYAVLQSHIDNFPMLDEFRGMNYDIVSNAALRSNQIQYRDDEPLIGGE